MAWWHNPDGTPAKPFKGQFDPSHAMPLVVILAVVIYLIVLKLIGTD